MSNRPETRPGFYFSGDDDPWIAGLFRDTERVWEGVTRIAGTIDEVIAESETRPERYRPKSDSTTG